MEGLEANSVEEEQHIMFLIRFKYGYPSEMEFRTLISLLKAAEER